MSFRLETPDGAYEAQSLIALLWEVLKHRWEHLWRGEGWRD